MSVITFRHCAACNHIQYLARTFCAACGTTDIATRSASGKGIVYAASLVHRAATPERRVEVPYMIVLVDVAEGFRMMAHDERSFTVDDRVTAGARDVAGRRVPYFTKD